MDVLANTGGHEPGYSIDRIEALNGRIGVSGAAVSPNSPLIGTTLADYHGVRIARIVAKNGINAQIVAPLGIALLQTTSPTDGGDVEGSIRTSRLDEQSPTEGGLFDVSGTLYASVTFTGEVAANALVRVDKFFGSVSVGTTPLTMRIGTQLDAQLNGQIIFGATGTGSAGWRHDIGIGDSILLGPGENAAGIHYNYKSSDLGGGAIGVVPFHLHNKDCSPPNSASSPGSMLVTEFIPTLDQSGDPIPGKDIDLVEYGPVRTSAVNDPLQEQPLIVELQLSGGLYQDQTHKVDITMKRPGDTGYSRTMTLKGRSGASLMPGLYRIRPRLTGSARLFCDQLPTTSPPSVADFEYWVLLIEDCNKNGIDDAVDIQNTTDPNTGLSWFDDWGLNGGLGANGRIDLCEWIELTGCHADVDFNMFLNGDDADLFGAWFEAGDPDADYNYDGFVNGDDFDAFVADFDAGCSS